MRQIPTRLSHIFETLALGVSLGVWLANVLADYSREQEGFLAEGGREGGREEERVLVVVVVVVCGSAVVDCGGI